MKGKVINFEILHVSEEDRRASIIQQLKSAKTQGYDIVYGLMLMDGFLYRDPETFPVDIEVKLISGMCEHPDHSYLNYYHRIVYNSFKHIRLPVWNSNSDSFLFLGGVPSRANRIKLLGKFYDADMLDSAVWSFFPPWTDSDKEWCRDAMSHYTDEQYAKFLNNCDKRIDDRYEQSKDYSRVSREEWDKQDTYNQPWVKDLSWMNPQVFADTVISVISEGNAYDPATNYNFLTEKTWRVVAMRQPFLFAGYPEQFDYAKSCGLRTFEQYMLIKDYAYILDEDARLDAVVANTQHFLKTYKQHEASIRADTEHNYNVFNKLFRDENKFLNSLAITELDKSYWFNQTGFSNLLKI